MTGDTARDGLRPVPPLKGQPDREPRAVPAAEAARRLRGPSSSCGDQGGAMTATHPSGLQAALRLNGLTAASCGRGLKTPAWGRSATAAARASGRRAVLADGFRLAVKWSGATATV
jgi:hypothetical protein